MMHLVVMKSVDQLMPCSEGSFVSGCNLSGIVGFQERTSVKEEVTNANLFLLKHHVSWICDNMTFMICRTVNLLETYFLLLSG